jgi:RNA polymerase sigma factor (TIGR02999 family)
MLSTGWQPVVPQKRYRLKNLRPAHPTPCDFFRPTLTRNLWLSIGSRLSNIFLLFHSLIIESGYRVGGQIMISIPEDVSQLLRAWNRGDSDAENELMQIVYDELRRLARNYLRRERADHTLQPTALVHEAYLRLVDQKSVEWQNRAHFYGIAALMMRRILVNYANGRERAKRGGEAQRLSLSAVDRLAGKQEFDLIALDDALKRLAEIDPQQSRIVELRYFGGLTNEEIAEVVGISVATVKREWSAARAYLRREVGND